MAVNRVMNDEDYPADQVGQDYQGGARDLLAYLGRQTLLKLARILRVLRKW